jgi:hypothetical protein
MWNNTTGVDVQLGRAMAMCAHPYAAWRRLSRGGRSFLLAAYVMVGYVGTLMFLMFA